MTYKSAFPTIGILGGGQLGRMSAMAAIRMGLNVHTLSPTHSGPVAPLGTANTGDWNDPNVMRRFVSACDVVTVESEWAPAEVAEQVAGDTPVFPTSRTLGTIRHKGRQRECLLAAGLPGPEFRLCSSLDDARAACDELGLPAMFKRYQGSYDGYGNATVKDVSEIEEAWESLADSDGLLIEQWVPFVRELATIVAVRPSGGHVAYPTVHVEQRDHRCHSVVLPAGVEAGVTSRTTELALEAAKAVGAVGLLATEMFELEDGSVLINELAPRPHNTGHVTIEACHTSQFENHIRSVLDWPLGESGMRVPAAAMVNVLGKQAGTATSITLPDALISPDVSVHIYGKIESRPKRKMGHVTVTGSSPQETLRVAEASAARIIL